MKVEEALEVLEKNRPVHVFGWEDLCDAYDIALESVSRRVKKKPEQYHCPVCMAAIHSVTLSDGVGKYSVNPNFCSVCGQAFDFGD